MKNLPLGALRAFEAAARTGSFRAAGEELGISPSAVSHAIRKLEDLIGVVLFEREGRTVRLNPGGEALLRHVSTAFAELRHGLETVGSRSGNLLRLHCAPSMAAQWLMPRLTRLLAEQSGLEVRLSAGAAYPRFQNDEFDADICYGPPRQEGLIVLPLGEETVTPLCTPEVAARIKTPEDLYQFALIESEHKRVRWNAWFAANGIEPPSPRGSRFDRSFMAIAAAVDGMGVALESTRLAEREFERGDLVAPLAGIAKDVTYIGHYLVFSPQAKRRQAVRMFATWLARELNLPAFSF
ncbi:MAG: LysR family transcriptional regulator [Rhizobiales bacterium PAR1]|nr:MAG: LysR family transcriptional regulator [Rhizobiales bacterium PAR1]